MTSGSDGSISSTPTRSPAPRPTGTRCRGPGRTTPAADGSPPPPRPAPDHQPTRTPDRSARTTSTPPTGRPTTRRPPAAPHRAAPPAAPDRTRPAPSPQPTPRRRRGRRRRRSRPSRLDGRSHPRDQQSLHIRPAEMHPARRVPHHRNQALARPTTQPLRSEASLGELLDDLSGREQVFAMFVS